MTRLEQAEPSAVALNDYFVIYATLCRDCTFKSFINELPERMVQFDDSAVTLKIIQKSFQGPQTSGWICNL